MMKFTLSISDKFEIEDLSKIRSMLDYEDLIINDNAYTLKLNKESAIFIINWLNKNYIQDEKITT